MLSAVFRAVPTHAILALAVAACAFDSSGVGGSATASGSGSGDVTGEASTTGDPTQQPTTSASMSASGDTTTDDTTLTTSMSSTTSDDTSSTSTGSAETDPPPESSGEDESSSTTSRPNPEVCDGFDNDGDGAVDEGSADNPDCDGCTFVLGTSGEYWFAICTNPRTWDSARDRCQLFSGDLAKIENADDQLMLLALVFEDHWMGIDDREVEAMWFWVDRTAARNGNMVIGYDGWNPIQPSGGLSENCAELDPGQSGWADADCEQLQPYVCRHPA